MRRRSLAVLAFLLVATWAVGAAAAGTLDAVKQKGVLTVGVKFRVPPFGFVDTTTGEISGFDVDVAKFIASKLGVKLQLKPVDQGSRIPELLEGNIDLIAANLTKGPNTAKVIDFSDPYVITGQGFIAKVGTVKSLADLEGKTIGVNAASSSEAGVRSALPSAKVVGFTDIKKALEALQSGEIDAGSGDSTLLPLLIPMLPAGAFEIPPVQISEVSYSLGLRKGDKDFLAAVNQALKDLEQSGEAKKLADKWFQPPKETAPASAPAAKAAGAITRRAATPPRVVAVVLKGVFLEGADVTVFTPDGAVYSQGKVAAVLGDEIYVDVEAEKFRGVQPGFAVGMNVEAGAAKDAIAKHQDVLTSVRDESKAEEEAFAKQKEQEGIAKEQRDVEADQKRYENKLAIERERATDNNEYYYRGPRGGRYYGRY